MGDIVEDPNATTTDLNEIMNGLAELDDELQEQYKELKDKLGFHHTLLIVILSIVAALLLFSIVFFVILRNSVSATSQMRVPDLSGFNVSM